MYITAIMQKHNLPWVIKINNKISFPKTFLNLTFVILAEVELKMPKYLQKACLHKPQYNITISNTVDEQALRQMNERSQLEVLESTNKIFERLPKSIGKYYLFFNFFICL